MTQLDRLRQMLDRLDAEVRDDLHDRGHSDAFWPNFATRSDELLKAAGDEHFDWMSAEIAALLQRHGLSVPEA